MAEMNDRGQMILMAGVMLAILFVALALLVNAAIYTDNVATRGGDSASEPLEYQSGVTDSVGALIDAENAVGDDFGTIGDNVSEGTQRIDETHRQYHLRRGAGTNTTLRTTTEGRYLTNKSTTGFSNWTANASAVRGFVINFNTTSMPYDSTFRIDLDGDDLDIKLNETENQLIVTHESETETIECTVTDPDTVRFDITGQRLGGEPCRFGFPEFNDDSQIGIENGENATGTYELTVMPGDLIENDVPSEIMTKAVYSADIDIRIDTPELSYERTVRIAPGEPDV